jgi:hypothetical protein
MHELADAERGLRRLRRRLRVPRLPRALGAGSVVPDATRNWQRVAADASTLRPRAAARRRIGRD